MKLSQIEKRIPQTWTNSKDIIQTDREYARRSSRARSTRGQENEAWALYKKIPSRESWGDLSGDRYVRYGFYICYYSVNLNKLLQIISKLRWSNKDNNN